MRSILVILISFIICSGLAYSQETESGERPLTKIEKFLKIRGQLVEKSFYEIWPDENQEIHNIVRSVLQNTGDRFSTIRHIHERLSNTILLTENPDYYIDRYTDLVEEKILLQGLKPDVQPFLQTYGSQLLLINSLTPEKALHQSTS